MTKKHPISFAASDEEYKLLEQIMQHHKRATFSDTIRFLILREAENFLPKNVSIEIKQPAKG